MKYIPEAAYRLLETNPHAKTEDIAAVADCSKRHARRYRQWMREHECRPLKAGVRPVSRSMTELSDEPFDFEAFCEQARKLQQRAQALDPMLNQDTITIDVDHPIGIMFVSCMHLGGRYTAHDLFAKLYQKTLDVPEIYWASLGDDIDGFIASFRDRAAVEKQLLSVPNQRDMLRSILTPLSEAGRLLLGTGSQHGSDWEKRATGRDPIKELYVNEFGVPFFDGTAYLELHVGQQVYRIALAHEFRGQSMWNPNHPQRKALMTRFPNADIVVMGDKHTPAMQYAPIYPEEYAAGNRNSPNALLLQAGTAKTGLDDFTIKNWSAGQFEWPIVIFYPDRFQLEWTFSLDRAISMIKNPIQS